MSIQRGLTTDQVGAPTHVLDETGRLDLAPVLPGFAVRMEDVFWP